MIPSLLRIKIVEERKKKLGLWIPIFLLYPFLLLAFIIALPILLVVLIVLIRKGIKVLKAGLALLTTFSSLRGLRIDVESEGSKVFISID